MHASSFENMKRCVDWYLPATARRVADIGASDVNGSYRQLMPPTVDYTGIDLAPGPGVDVVLDNPYELPFEDESFDVVLSGQMLEHCPQFWRTFNEIARILAPGGLLFMIAPSAGPIHRYPVDCYRYYPDAYQALAEWSGLELIHCWLDDRGPWRDLVGVFGKQSDVKIRTEAPISNFRVTPFAPSAIAAEEATAGEVIYTDVLAQLHQEIEPSLYIEIGVRRGNSLRLAEGNAIGVDPAMDLDPALGLSDNERLRLFEQTSDDFFFFNADAIDHPVELAFIDGMHLVDFVYRDLLNIERHMSPNGVVLIDDVLPSHAHQATRKRQTQVWCGDVWRIVPLLEQLRPDLTLTLLDTAPTGLLMITGLKPKNERLRNQYNPTMRKLLAESPQPPDAVLARTNALSPNSAVLQEALSVAKNR